MPDPNHRESFERRAQSVLQVLIAAALVWVGAEVVSTGKSVAKLETLTTVQSVNITEMKTEISGLRSQVTSAALAAATAANAAAVASLKGQK